MKLLFTRARVPYFQNGALLLSEETSVGVQGETIAFVGEVLAGFSADRTFDCHGGLLLPGFVNAHTHSPLCLLRGRGEGLRLHDWLSEVVWPFEARHTYESCYWGTLLNAAESIRSGTTCLNDMYIHSDAVAAALQESGLRALVTATVTDQLLADEPNRLEEIAALAEQYRDSTLIRIGIAPHAVYTCSQETLRSVSALSGRLRLPVHTHVAETIREVETCAAEHGKTPLQLLDETGLIHAHSLLAHCVYLSEADIRLAAERGACIVHCPRSNLKLGSGIAPVARFLEAGVRTAIGTDSSASNNNQDILEELRFAALLQKGREMDPTVFSLEQCLDMADKSALHAMGFTNSGTIMPGMAADLIVVDTSTPVWMPEGDALANLLYAGHSSDVVLTMVGGQILYEHGTYLTLDIERLHWEIQRLMLRMTK